MTSNLIYIGDLDKVRLLEVLCKNMPRGGAFQTVVTQLRERGDAFKKPPPPPPSFIKRVLSFLRF